MGIIWKYLDKRGAAASAVRDYGNMEHIISHTDGRVRAAYQKMAGIGSPQPDGMPHAHNPRAAEERIIRGIGDVDVLLERYRQAAEYMAWFQPAWHTTKRTAPCSGWPCCCTGKVSNFEDDISV